MSNLLLWLSDIVYSMGYVGIVLLIVLGYLHLPILAEITLPLAGFLVGQGRLTFVLVDRPSRKPGFPALWIPGN